MIDEFFTLQDKSIIEDLNRYLRILFPKRDQAAQKIFDTLDNYLIIILMDFGHLGQSVESNKKFLSQPNLLFLKAFVQWFILTLEICNSQQPFDMKIVYWGTGSWRPFLGYF